MQTWLRKGVAPRVATSALAAAVLSGCFAYVPVPAESLVPGDRVQVQLRETQSVRAGSVTANDVIEVTGELVSSDSAGLNVSAFYLRAPNGYEQAAIGETARIPVVNVAEVRENRLSPLRTAAVAGLAAVAGALFVTQVASPRGGGGVEGPPGGSQ